MHVPLQAALDSMYRGSRDVDVRAGLLRLVLHVLHNYGEDLISGWAPLLRQVLLVNGVTTSSVLHLGLVTMPLSLLPRHCHEKVSTRIAQLFGTFKMH